MDVGHRTSVFRIIRTKLFVLFVSQAETAQPDLRPEQQAKQQITVHPYVTFNPNQQNYLYISTATNTVSLGDTLSLKLSINTADPTHKDLIKHITYLVRPKHRVKFLGHFRK